MSHDISKLPKWAQTEIKRLETNAKDCQRKLDEAVGAIGTESNVWTERYDGDSPELFVKTYLPANSTIHFKVGGHTVTVKHFINGSLQVLAQGGLLLVSPQSSNVVHLHTFPIGADYERKPNED